MNKTGSGITALSLKYIRHWFGAGRRNGYGIHSPYLYSLVRNIIYNKVEWTVPPEIIANHQKQKKERREIQIHDHGAGSRIGSPGVRTVQSLVRNSSVTIKQGALLYRLTKWYQPNLILEFGTGLGTSTSYLAAGTGNCPIVSVEGSPEKHKFAVENSKNAGTGRVNFLLGTFDSCFEMLLERVEERTIIFIDGDHRYIPTVEKVGKLLQKTPIVDMMIILDDIYWSDEMEEAWKTCASDPLADISIDLFNFGIIIKREGIAKQHLKLRF